MVSISPGSSQPQRFDHLADRNTALYRRYADDLVRESESPFRANHA